VKRFVAIWFPYLKTDWFSIRQPNLPHIPFVLVKQDHGRKLITEANVLAIQESIHAGMVAADAKAILPSLEVMDDPIDLTERLLKRIAAWCIRFSPSVAIDGDDGLILEVTGCSHLWGGDAPYVKNITERFKKIGYSVRVSIADTIGAAWAVSRFEKENLIVENAQQSKALFYLPVAALRLEDEITERLYQLGLRQIKDVIGIQKLALRRRFGESMIKRINQALGLEEEFIHPVQEPSPYEERLPCLEPIITATGIEIALKRLLENLCKRLRQEGKGIRSAVLKCYRIDGKTEQVEIGTIRASHHADHLFRLFEIKISKIEPGFGIELFVLNAGKIEDHSSLQEKIWNNNTGLQDEKISELLDRLSNKISIRSIRRYLPAEHYWPERSVKAAASLDEKAATSWKVDRPRPLQLLSRPERIEVTAPIPDYPPMNFRWKGTLHTIKKADGPERIEQEWWIEQGQHRDYYAVEDEHGNRYWLFRLGHYTDKNYQWFLHGFFV
jgi:protein ImuB